MAGNGVLKAASYLWSSFWKYIDNVDTLGEETRHKNKKYLEAFSEEMVGLSKGSFLKYVVDLPQM